MNIGIPYREYYLIDVDKDYLGMAGDLKILNPRNRRLLKFKGKMRIKILNFFVLQLPSQGQITIPSNPVRSNVQDEEEHLNRPGHILQDEPQINTSSESELTVEYINEASTSGLTTGTQNEAEIKIEGRRIVDLNFFLNSLLQLSNHNPTFGCTLQNLKVIQEIRHGFSSTIIFKCNMCNSKFRRSTVDDKKDMDVNTAAVTGIMSIGCGYSNMEELFSAMEVPCMGTRLYTQYHEEVCKGWEKAGVDLMKDAAAEEAKLAIEANEVDSDGVPLITVICDGCWSKRSYRTNYSALSGVAAIVGQKTGKVLYIGVKNKFCTMCSRAASNNLDPKPHTCFKNFAGGSSGMEAAVLVEGFQDSLESYGIKYAKMVADGDSSTYKRILESRPYNNITVEKVECRNHLLRNFCNKLKILSTNTAFPLHLRKLINDKTIKRLRRAIVGAIRHRKQDLSNGLTQLKKDIDNSICHVFGRHLNCATYFCDNKEEKDLLVDIEKSPQFHMRLEQIIKTLANNSRSLIQDMDSNIVEQFNSIVAKFVGGKRINYSLRRSYQGRCSAAVVSFNSKRPIYTLHKSMYGSSPNRIKTIELARATKAARATEIRRKRKIAGNPVQRKKKSTRDQSNNPDYGEACQKPDMDPESFEDEKTKFLETLKLTADERNKLQVETILQSQSSKWMETRRKLLTASNFFKVCRRKPTTSCINLVKTLLYSSETLNVHSIIHGKKYEQLALLQLERQENIKINPCGLFVDDELFFLGASPDGLIGEDTIVEIKCPSSAFHMNPNDAIRAGKIQLLAYQDQNIEIKKNVSWYYQIQGQLHVTKRNTCLFAFWTGEEHNLKTIYINRDDTFWKENMGNKLTKFYMECLLPELVDPRHTRNMPIRDNIPVVRQLF